MKPLISVLMPVFNCAGTLEVAVRSILAQTFRNWEMLILDDGSSDNTVAVARRIHDVRLRVITDTRGNLGLGTRLNQGVQFVRGDFIARMDGDDISFPQRLERQLGFLEKNPEVDLVGCSMVIFRSSGEVTGLQHARRTHEDIVGSAFRSCLLPHATWMGRKDWFRRHRYDARWRRVEDRELLLRTRNCSAFAGITEPLYAYRVDHVSMRTNTIARVEYLKALFEDARRGAWLHDCAGSCAEVAKLVVDSVALATRSDRIFLRHRGHRIEDKRVLEEWQALWSGLGQISSGAC